MNPLRRAPRSLNLPQSLHARAIPTSRRPICLTSLQTTATLHTTAIKPATPLNHPPAPGPPPKPPTPEPSADADRVSRKKRNAELVERGRELKNQSPQEPGTALQRRFWKEVKIENTNEGYQIHLDTRPLRTPSRHALTIPHTKPHLASAIALEWDLLVTAQQALKQHYIPLTSLASRALDIARADTAGDATVRSAVVTMIMRYLNTDTLLCWAPAPASQSDEEDKESITKHFSAPASGSSAPGVTLREKQKAVAEPIMEFLTTKLWPGTQLLPALSEDSIMPLPQPEGTAEAIRRWAEGLSAWELAALERGVLASKSVCVASRLLVQWRRGGLGRGQGEEKVGEAEAKQDGEENVFTVEDAAEACSVEVRWQTGMWGEVEDTHDVEKEDVLRQLGSMVLLVS